MGRATRPWGGRSPGGDSSPRGPRIPERAQGPSGLGSHRAPGSDRTVLGTRSRVLSISASIAMRETALGSFRTEGAEPATTVCPTHSPSGLRCKLYRFCEARWTAHLPPQEAHAARQRRDVNSKSAPPMRAGRSTGQTRSTARRERSVGLARSGPSGRE